MEVFNRALALARLNGDEALLERKLESFMAEAPAHIAALRAALVAGDGERVRERARALETSSREIGAEGLEALATRVGSASDLGSVLDEPEKMEMELEWLKRVLDQDRCSGNL